MERFNAEMDPIVRDWASGNTGPEWMQASAGKKTKRITQLIRRSQTFREEMLDHDTLMLETSDAYWMNAAQIIEIQPRKTAVPAPRPGPTSTTVNASKTPLPSL